MKGEGYVRVESVRVGEEEAAGVPYSNVWPCDICNPFIRRPKQHSLHSRDN